MKLVNFRVPSSILSYALCKTTGPLHVPGQNFLFYVAAQKQSRTIAKCVLMLFVPRVTVKILEQAKSGAIYSVPIYDIHEFCFIIFDKRHDP